MICQVPPDLRLLPVLGVLGRLLKAQVKPSLVVWWLITPVILAPESLEQDGEFKDSLGIYSEFVSQIKEKKKKSQDGASSWSPPSWPIEFVVSAFSTPGRQGVA